MVPYHPPHYEGGNRQPDATQTHVPAMGTVLIKVTAGERAEPPRMPEVLNRQERRRRKALARAAR